MMTPSSSYTDHNIGDDNVGDDNSNKAVPTSSLEAVKALIKGVTITRRWSNNDTEGDFQMTGTAFQMAKEWKGSRNPLLLKAFE